MKSSVRFSCFPRTLAPPSFVHEVVKAFFAHEKEIGTELLGEGNHRKSDEVLKIISPDLTKLGFAVESGKGGDEIIARPVFFGENGVPTLRYEVDAYHSVWKCGLEVEGTRAIRGGALYRDLIQAMVMIEVDHLCIAVPNIVFWGKSGKSRSYVEAVNTCDALFGHSRIRIPFGLTLIGY